VDLVHSHGYKVLVVDDFSLQVDIEIVSVFYNKNLENLTKALRKLLRKENYPTEANNLHNEFHPERNRNVKRRIWYTGENIRIPFEQDFDGYLSFDATQSCKGNAYTPLWMLNVSWFERKRENNRIGLKLHIDDLLVVRMLGADKKRSICAFVGNPESTRLRAIASFEQKLPVTKLGRFYGKFATHKFNVGSEHQFILTFENDLYPGYVTEKLVENYSCDSVPIYRGLFDESNSDFNPNAFINSLDFQDFEECGDYLIGLTHEEYRKIYEQPLFYRKPSLNSISEVLLGDNLN